MRTTLKIGIIIIPLFILLKVEISTAQGSNDIEMQAMEKVKDLQGEWAGTGWYQRGNEKRYEFNQTENVQARLDGQLLVIEGQGKNPKNGEVVFEAFAVMHYSPEKELYQFSAYTKDGYTLASSKFEENNLIWWFDTPRGTIRYTIDFTADTWIEDGHFSPNGENWYQFLHMELKKL